MSDLTDRALDTASARGASYADVRSVRRLEESISIKTGRVEGVASGESEGFGVRVLVDGAWGFASSHVLTTAEADRVAAEAVRIARASATALRDQTRLDDRPPAHGRYETPLEEDPFAVPLETKIADLLAADQAAARVKGIAFTESSYAAQREWKTFAATDGSLTEQVITHVGAGIEANAVDGDEHQRRSYPDSGGGWGGGGYEIVRRLGLAERAEPLADGGRRAADRAAVPVRPVHDHPRPEPALPPGPRVVRPPDRARPGLRDRGVVRRDELPDHRQARRGLPLRLGPHRHRGRRHRARRHGHVRLGRRGRRGAGRAARPERDLRRLPVAAARPRRGSAARAAARCGPTAGTGSRSSG